MFSGLVNDGVYENIFLPDLPYVKGENGGEFSMHSFVLVSSIS